ncbi:MAG: nicotinate-nucleotide adenylyltransferase [Ilumatobacteraceae bacterium]
MPGDTAKPQRIGVFGGTFDPPHVGHLVTAINVAYELELDPVIMMVANVPWQKTGTRPITPAEDRLALVEAAVAHVPRLIAGDHEIRAGGDSFTADTLATLGCEFRGAELFLILGDDAAARIHTWARADEVIQRARLVVVDRPGEPVALDPNIEWLRVEVPRLEVSSTDLRSRWADGRPLDYLVTDDVLDVVRERGLYSEQAIA